MTGEDRLADHPKSARRASMMMNQESNPLFDELLMAATGHYPRRDEATTEVDPEVAAARFLRMVSGMP